MTREHVSDIWNERVKGHSHYDFVDVNINSDNLLFIDPVLIEMNQGKWYKDANLIVQSFFDEFYKAYRDNNISRKRELLSHAGEQNATRFGYGRGDNGRGNTVNGLLAIFSPLEDYIERISTIEKAVDLPLLLTRFSQDGLSDLLTNILHNHLNEYMLKQMEKFKVKSNGRTKYWTWDLASLSWKEVSPPSYKVNNQELLIVPKSIVRKNYLFSIEQFFSRVLIERKRSAGEYYDNDKDRFIPKKEVENIIKNKSDFGIHWKYEESLIYIKDNNDALDEYHRRLHSFYSKRKGMGDKELDDLIYKERIMLKKK